MKILKSITVLGAVVIVSFVMLQVKDVMFSKDVSEYDHAPSSLLEVDGTFTQTLDTVNKMLDKGQISVKQAKEVSDRIMAEVEKADKKLEDAGLTQEKREEIKKELEEVTKKIMEEMKKANE